MKVTTERTPPPPQLQTDLICYKRKGTALAGSCAPNAPLPSPPEKLPCTLQKKRRIGRVC